jgi:type IV secretion system protein VirD4
VVITTGPADLLELRDRAHDRVQRALVRPGRLPRLRPPLPTLDGRRYGLDGQRAYMGSLDGTWIQAPRQTSVVVIAAQGARKTRAVVIPNVAQWDGCVVSTTTKGDVLRHSFAARTRRGKVWVFDPLGIIPVLPDGVHRLEWSPLRGCKNAEVARLQAQRLCQDAGKGSTDRTHWKTRGTQLLSALLHAAGLAGYPMSTVVEWVDKTSLDQAQQILLHHQNVRTWGVLEGLKNTPERERGSFWSAVTGILAPFHSDVVLNSADAAGGCAFEPIEFLASGNTVYIVAPSDAQIDAAPLIVGLVEEIRTAARYVSDQLGGELPIPLLLALDEVCNLCPLESLPTIIWEARARNIVVIAVFQAVGQAVARYGRDIVDALLYNGGVGTLFLHGCGEHDVMTRLEELGGPMWVPQTTSTASRSATGPLAGFRWLDVTHSASTNHGWVKVPRYPGNVVREIAEGQAWIVLRNCPLGLIEVRDFTTLSPFREWAAMSPVLDVVTATARSAGQRN